MYKFAKIYESSEYGQIVVMIDDVEGEAGVCIYFYLDDIGLSRITFEYQDDAESTGWEKAEIYFDMLDLEETIDIIENLISSIVDNEE